MKARDVSGPDVAGHSVFDSIELYRNILIIVSAELLSR